jgi:hypothetical protein
MLETDHIRLLSPAVVHLVYDLNFSARLVHSIQRGEMFQDWSSLHTRKRPRLQKVYPSEWLSWVWWWNLNRKKV